MPSHLCCGGWKRWAASSPRERRRRVRSEGHRARRPFLRELPIVLDAHTAERAWEAATPPAKRHRLTVYDAAYLEFAQRRLPPATLDRDLCTAAAAVGVDILDTAA